MIVERTHKDGGFVRLRFEEFFSNMSSADCRYILHLLVNDYGMSISEIDRMFMAAIGGAKSTRKKIHILNSYKIFRKEYMTDGTIQGICSHKE